MTARESKPNPKRVVAHGHASIEKIDHKARHAEVCTVCISVIEEPDGTREVVAHVGLECLDPAANLAPCQFATSFRGVIRPGRSAAEAVEKTGRKLYDKFCESLAAVPTIDRAVEHCLHELRRADERPAARTAAGGALDWLRSFMAWRPKPKGGE